MLIRIFRDDSWLCSSTEASTATNAGDGTDEDHPQGSGGHHLLCHQSGQFHSSVERSIHPYSSSVSICSLIRHFIRVSDWWRMIGEYSLHFSFSIIRTCSLVLIFYDLLLYLIRFSRKPMKFTFVSPLPLLVFHQTGLLTTVHLSSGAARVSSALYELWPSETLTWPSCLHESWATIWMETRA